MMCALSELWRRINARDYDFVYVVAQHASSQSVNGKKLRIKYNYFNAYGKKNKKNYFNKPHTCPRCVFVE